jgi:hypothetical protein
MTTTTMRCMTKMFENLNKCRYGSWTDVFHKKSEGTRHTFRFRSKMRATITRQNEEAYYLRRIRNSCEGEVSKPSDSSTAAARIDSDGVHNVSDNQAGLGLAKPA